MSWYVVYHRPYVILCSVVVVDHIPVVVHSHPYDMHWFPLRVNDQVLTLPHNPVFVMVHYSPLCPLYVYVR